MQEIALNQIQNTKWIPDQVFYIIMIITIVNTILMFLFLFKNKMQIMQIFLSIILIMISLILIIQGINNIQINFNKIINFKDPLILVDILNLLLFFISAYVLIIFGVKIFINLKNTSLDPKEGELIKQKSEKISADILNVEHITNIRINQRAPYAIIAKGFNPITNQEQIFKSYYIWDDILFLIKDKNRVDIYIDKSNPKRYYMDVNSLLYGG